MANSKQISFHDGQLDVFNSDARFKVISAGRRWGKTYYACVEAMVKVMEPYPIHIGVWYVGPTFGQAFEVSWPYFVGIWPEMWENTVAHEGRLKAKNGRWLSIKGSDRPEVLTGRALSHVAVDEYASMRPAVFEHVLRPSLTDVAGSATFIGSPDGKNHFYQLLLDAQHLDGYKAWQFETADNPFIPSEEIDHARRTLSTLAFKRQYLGSFAEGSGNIFTEDKIVTGECPNDGQVYMAIDLAGFAGEVDAKKAKYSRLDDTAIAIVNVSRQGWHVLDIVAGRWGVRETALRIIRLAKEYKPVTVGIEKGVLHQAVMPYLKDKMREFNTFPAVREVTHGSKNKIDRITWALQGRLEQGRCTFAPGEYLRKFKEQALDFPSRLTHDDMLDALAYIDQLAVVDYRDDEWQSSFWQPVDAEVGF